MMKNISAEKSIESLACLDGVPMFSVPISTSNLVQPEFERFLSYSKVFFKNRHYTNNGELVRKLEQRLADFHEAKHCIAFCSGFWALVLTISSLAKEGRNEIIIPSLTYRRMADIAAWCKLTPRFCEVDADTLSLNEQTVRECITEQTALILAVHPIVNCCDPVGLENLSNETGIPLLFDGVESAYERTQSGKVGSFGNAECFSMHASKLLNGFEGGYVTTDDDALATKLKMLRTFGFKGKDNCFVANGLNAKLNEVHAAMALANLDELDKQISKNKENYYQYLTQLRGIPGIRILEFDESFDTSYKNIVAEITPDWPISRDLTVDILNAENILARAYYSPPLHLKKMNYPHIKSSLEVTKGLAERYVLLPCGDFIGAQEIDSVVSLLSLIQVNGLDIHHSLTLRSKC